MTLKYLSFSIYASLGNGQLAKAYHEQFIKILNDSEDNKEKVFAYEQMGNTYTILKDYESAITLFHVCRSTSYHSLYLYIEFFFTEFVYKFIAIINVPDF